MHHHRIASSSRSTAKRLGRVVFGCLLALAAPAHAADVCVWILAGQSNANGHGAVAELSPAAQAKLARGDAQVALNYYNSLAVGEPWRASYQWVPLQTGTGGPVTGAFGTEIGFGLTLDAAKRPCTVDAIIKMAQGSTTLQTEWNVHNPAGLWPAFRSFTNAALAQVSQAGLTYDVRGLIWIQGESDSAVAGGGAAATYEANLTDLIAAARAHFARPMLDVYVTQLSANIRVAGAPTAYLTQVRDAQAAVTTAVPHTYLVPTDDLPLLPESTGSWDYQVHYTAAALETLGARIAAAALENEAPYVNP